MSTREANECIKTIPYIKQLLDEVEHDIMNYQNRGLCYRGVLLCSYSVKSFAIVVFAVVLMYLLWCSDACVKILLWCCGAVLMSLYRNTC